MHITMATVLISLLCAFHFFQLSDQCFHGVERKTPLNGLQHWFIARLCGFTCQRIMGEQGQGCY